MPMNDNHTPTGNQPEGTPAVPPLTEPTGLPKNARSRRELSNSPNTPSTSPPVPVLDATLDEDDLKLSISVRVTGRTVRFATLEFNKTAYGATRDQRRGIFFQQLEHLLTEVQQAVATKVNTKLDAGKKPDPEKDDDNSQHPSRNGSKRPLLTKKIPPYVGPEGFPEFMRIHIPPELNAE